jgi:hypothetical protein
MPFDLQFAINLIYPAALSAYQIMNVPKPVLLPPGYALVNHMLLESNIFGLVAWNQAASTSLVAFRGTQTIMDWVDNVDMIPLPPLYEHVGQERLWCTEVSSLWTLSMHIC